MRAQSAARFIASIGALALGAICRGTPTGFDTELAREPAMVQTIAGRSVLGILDGCRDGRLYLRLATDGGEVGYSFAPVEIARLTLPGSELHADAIELAERGDLAAALPRWEALARHRLRYLPVLTTEDRQVLWTLAEHAAEADPGTVAAVLQHLEAMAASAEERFLIVEARLELALRAGDVDAMRSLAEGWCALADTAASSARGWRVLARLAYDSGDYDRARWIALQPVTFFGDVIVRDLGACYAIAVAAADRMGDPAHASILVADMRRRSIPWPVDPAWAGLHEHYLHASMAAPERPFFPHQPVNPKAPVPAQAPLLDSVRKLLIPTS